jgi:hypothetical protein
MHVAPSLVPTFFLRGIYMQKHILAFNRALSQARATVRSTRRDVVTLSAMRKDINKLGKQLSACMNHETDTMWIAMICDKPHFKISLNGIESFKCLHLETMLTTLENLGECIKTNDYAEYLNREYHYDVAGMKVTVDAYVKSDSPTCRKVPVGSETVTNIVYELRCD